MASSNEERSCAEGVDVNVGNAVLGVGGGGGGVTLGFFNCASSDVRFVSVEGVMFEDSRLTKGLSIENSSPNTVSNF